MKKALWIPYAAGLAMLAVVGFGSRLGADGDLDWGLLVQRELNDRSESLFGVGTPLRQSALGPFTDADSTNAIKVADHLRVSLVSSAVHFSTDQIVLWP